MRLMYASENRKKDMTFQWGAGGGKIVDQLPIFDAEIQSVCVH